jgi:hypothetical protein
MARSTFNHNPLGETGKISKHISEQGKIRADDGNRTRMTSLEGWGSTIELHPRDLADADIDGRPQ